MKNIGYVCVSTDKQADRGVSLDTQAEKIRAMAVIHNAEFVDLIVDDDESAKSLNRPGMERLLALVDAKKVQAVIVAKLDRLIGRTSDDIGRARTEAYQRRADSPFYGKLNLDAVYSSTEYRARVNRKV